MNTRNGSEQVTGSQFSMIVHEKDYNKITDLLDRRFSGGADGDRFERLYFRRSRFDQVSKSLSCTQFFCNFSSRLFSSVTCHGWLRGRRGRRGRGGGGGGWEGWSTHTKLPSSSQSSDHFVFVSRHADPEK